MFFFFSLRVTRLFPKEASFCVPPNPLTLFSQTKLVFFLSWRHHLCVCCMFKGGFIKTRVVTKTFWLLCFLLLSVLPNCEPWYIDFFYTLEPTRRVCFCTRGYMCCNKVRTHLLHPPSLFFYACAVLRLWSHESRDHSRLYIIHGKKAPSLSHPKLLPPFCHLFQIAFRSQNWLRFGCVCLYDQTIWICLTVSSVSCGCCSFDRSWFTHQNSLCQQKKTTIKGNTKRGWSWPRHHIHTHTSRHVYFLYPLKLLRPQTLYYSLSLLSLNLRLFVNCSPRPQYLDWFS